jgi:O-antigen ligase
MPPPKPLETNYAYVFLKIILYALLLTPLWVWSIFVFPFITSKILYFRILVELALAVYIPLALLYPEIRPRSNWITKAVWIYLGVVFLTSLFGVDFYRSFWGTIERGEGIITLLHFILYFTMLSAVFTDRKQWRRYLLFAVTATLLAALYGLAQLLNFSGVIPAGTTRVSGTIGNAAFFAAVMIFGIALCLVLLEEATSQKSRIYLGLVLVFEVGMLYQSQTRGAILAAFFAFMIYLLFSVFHSESKKAKIASLVFLVLLVGFGVLVYQNRSSSWVRANSTLQRLSTISPHDITTESRLDTWGASWKAFKDRFLTGYGYENYNVAFNKYFPARIYKDQGSQIWFDRAHNVFFDVAVTSGIFGLFAYLGIFAAAFFVLWKLFRKLPPALGWKIPVITGVALLAYFLQNLFVFDTQATYLMFFLVLAYVVFLKNQFFPAVSPPRQSYPPGIFLSAILVGLLVFVAYFVNIKPGRANYQALQGIKLSKIGTYNKVTSAFAKALSFGTYMDQEIRQKMVDYSLEAIANGQISSQEQFQIYQYLISELEKSIKESPRDVKNYLYLMNVLNRLAGNQQTTDRILALGEKALALSPSRAQIYFELGQAYFFKRDFASGLKQFQKAVELNPETREAHFQYLLAGIVAHDPELAAREQELIIKQLSYKFGVKDYLALASAYHQAVQKDKVIETYLEALKLEPGSFQIHGGLAEAYGEVCDLKNAQSQVDEAVRINPSFTLSGVEFMRQIEKNCGK